MMSSYLLANNSDLYLYLFLQSLRSLMFLSINTQIVYFCSWFKVEYSVIIYSSLFTDFSSSPKSRFFADARSGLTLPMKSSFEILRILYLTHVGL